MGPVLLFHVGIVVFLMRSSSVSRTPARALLQPLEHVMVEELAPVITVQTQQRKGQARLHILQRCQRPHGPGPTSPAVPPRSSRNRPHRPSTRTPRPRSRRTAPPCPPQPARFVFFPQRAANGDLVPQQGSRPRQRPAQPLPPQRFQQPVQRPPAGQQELVPHFPWHPPLILLIGGNPLRQHRHQTPPTGKVRRLPNRPQPGCPADLAHTSPAAQ